MIKIIRDYKPICKGYEKSLKNFLSRVLVLERFDKKKDIFIILTNDYRIKTINKRFLLKNHITDVISFDLGNLCEIYVNCDYARKLGHFSYWTAFYSLHGLLHIIGYEHKFKPDEPLMMEKQTEYMKLWNF